MYIGYTEKFVVEKKSAAKECKILRKAIKKTLDETYEAQMRKFY